MNPLRRFSRYRHENERGATLILVAISMTMLIGASGLSVDLGRMVVVNRSLQSVADAAALDAARYINIPETTVNPSAADNLVVHADNSATNNGSSANLSVSQGVWGVTSGVTGFTPKTSTFCKGTTPPSGNVPCNAVEVIASQSLSNLFHRGSSTLSRIAIATDTPEAGFSIGSYLASYNSQQMPILNTVLAQLGFTGSLTAVGYDGLANTDVTVQQLIAASGGVLTPTNVMTLALNGATWDTYLYNAVESQQALLSCGSSPAPFPCSAGSALLPFVQAAGPLSSTPLQLCSFVSINGLGCGQLPQIDLSANLNVLQTLITESEEANLANGNSALDVTNDLNADLPLLGLTSASLSLKLIQPPQVAYGPVNTTASTSQVNASLSLTFPVLLGSETLTIPISGATGTATIKTITCQNNAMFKTNFSANTTASGPNNVTLNGTTVATLTLPGTSNGSITFGASEVPPSPATVLLTPPNPDPINGGVGIAFSTPLVGIPAIVTTLLSSTLPSVLQPILQALGVQVAGASLADLSTNCAPVSLVR